VPAYLVASSVAIGRMEENKHYLSDVIAGVAIGLAAGTWVALGRSRIRLEASARGVSRSRPTGSRARFTGV
jgi:membrane-associated phospholipid phosphatase